MARNVDVRNRITVDDETAAKMRRIAARFRGVARVAEKVGETTKKWGRSMAPASVAAGALGVRIFNTAVTFERSMNRVKAISGATGEQLSSLRDLAKELGSSTAFSASQAAGGMAFLAQAGWKTEQILAGIPAVLSLAAAAGQELEFTADVMSNIMGAFKIPAEEATRVADVLAHTTSSTNVDLEMLGETMKNAAPIAAKFGATIEDTAAMAGLLGNIGIQGSDAGTALKRSFLAMAAPASKGGRILKRLGVVTKDAEGNMRPVADILAELGEQLSKVGSGTALGAIDAIFGKIGMAGASELLDLAASGQLQELVAGYDAIGGRAKRMADTMMEGAPGAVAEMISAFEGLEIAMGESGFLATITKGIRKVTAWAQALSQSNPELLKWVAIIGAVVAVAAPVLFTFGMMASGIAGIATAAAALTPVLAFLAAAIKAVGLAIIMNPIGALVAAIAVGAVLIVTNWETVKAWFSSFFDWLGEGFDQVLGWIRETFGWVGDLADKLGRLPGIIGFAGRGLGALTDALGGDSAPREQRRSIIGDAARAGAVGAQRVDMSGSVGVRIDATGFPPGTRTSVSSEGPVEPSLNTGQAMVMP